MRCWGAAVRQFLPTGWRGRLSWGGGFLSDDRLGVLRGGASKDGMWRADTSDRGTRWTHSSRASNFSDACEAMAAHLRAAGFEVPERTEGS